MHILESFKELVHDVLLVDFFQDICSDDSMQVCLHVVKNQVDVPVILRFEDGAKPAVRGCALMSLFCPGPFRTYRSDSFQGLPLLSILIHILTWQLGKVMMSTHLMIFSTFVSS